MLVMYQDQAENPFKRYDVDSRIGLYNEVNCVLYQPFSPAESLLALTRIALQMVFLIKKKDQFI